MPDAREASQATEQITRLERVFCFMRPPPSGFFTPRQGIR
ncbi:hypothetical protein (plasmid) [Klebsiella pneumoniae]|uniref:Uncharacterized protein n=3 Tax=Enterobacterales TaxID=91347 RepID=A0A090N2K3_CITFR|nr:hypothetical protein [Klebsiella pneumoniae]PQB14450.1 hypothetical protein CWT02_4501 [Salmonella enterica subsp. enterica serovar Cubana]CEF90308.1 hypothetical protein [Citrobacter freundii]CZR15271.1 hypothetical protein [Yersinia pseudotuberculosis]AOO34908.1 hypothetical protein [Klebsiella pneumoniae]